MKIFYSDHLVLPPPKYALLRERVHSAGLAAPDNLRPAGLAQAIEESRAELAIYIAGADPYQGDRLGRLSLSMAGLLARDRLVADTAEIHFQTVRLAAALARNRQ